MEFKLFIFDMDGTIVDSALDFDEMRRELEFPEGVPLLEHIELLAKTEPQERIDHYMKVIHKHEERGGLASVPMPGAADFLNFLDSSGLRKAVLTRNSLPVAKLTFDKLQWEFESVISRDCVAKPKPYPDGLFHICETLGVEPRECCYMGDFSFDLETAKKAGMPAILYSPLENPELEAQADLVVRDFESLTNNFKEEFLTPLGFKS
jgi:HAD superfamily hydrolase (TIGR01509 family)